MSKRYDPGPDDDDERSYDDARRKSQPSNVKIQVACRVRPLSIKEGIRGERSIIPPNNSSRRVNVVDPAAFSLSSRDRHSSTSLTLSNWTRSFDFDYTFGLSSNQNHLFQRIGIPMIIFHMMKYKTNFITFCCDDVKVVKKKKIRIYF